MRKPHATVHTVGIPADCKIPLVLLNRRDEKISHAIYDLDPNDFPFGGYRFVNFTPIKCYVECAGRRGVIKPGDDQRLNPGNKAKKAIQIKVWTKNKESGRPEEVFRSMRTNLPNKRLLIFFYPGTDEAGRSVVKCRSLGDFQPDR